MDGRERGIRVPLVLIGGVYGFVQGGATGGFLGMTAGFVVGSLTTSMVAGVGIMATGFVLLWLQAGGAVRIAAVFDPALPVVPPSAEGVATAPPPTPGTGTLAATVEPGRSGPVACLANRIGRTVDFEYRWGRAGAWTEGSLPTGGQGLVLSEAGSDDTFEVRWPRRAGSSSLRTRWIRTVRVTGPVALEACPELRALEFHREGSSIELIRADRRPRSMVCLINRTGGDLRYAKAWNDEDWTPAVVERGHRQWFDNEPGSTFRVRLPDRVDAPEADGVARELAVRDTRHGGECMDGAAYIVALDGDRVTLEPAN